MAAFKCKMCGANLTLTEGVTVVECEYCGSSQTVPAANDEKKMTQFTRANNLRFRCEFDKAAGIYESIVADFPDEPEAYWGLVLCKYGIEYVDDPQTHKKIPTCHRTSVENVTEDSDYRKALENADPVAKSLYQEEAEQIETLCRSILEVSVKEEPYDIFICYKETDESGDRTLDSVLAQEVYDALVGKGYRVFFSRITLEDKLGTQYEPYIFAALNSAKVMLAFGTDPDYFNAVWVKNEWSRFLQLIAKGEKKVLIPCYKGMDPYDMPKEFKGLQAQDLGKLGAVQDLLRGIEKIIPKEKVETKVERVVVRETASPQSATVVSLLKRAFMFLEDGNWKDATDYCNRVLDIDPENAHAYVGLLMAEKQTRKQDDLKNLDKPFDSDLNYRKILTYGDADLVEQFNGYINYIKNRNEENRKNKIYNEAVCLMNSGEKAEDFQKASKLFRSIPGFKDADALYINAPYKHAEHLIEHSKRIFNSQTPDEELNEHLKDCGAILSIILQLPKREDSNTVISDMKQIVDWGRRYLKKRSHVRDLNSTRNWAMKDCYDDFSDFDFSGKFIAAVIISVICLIPLGVFGSGFFSEYGHDVSHILAFGIVAGVPVIIIGVFIIRLLASFLPTFCHNRLSKKRIKRIDEEFITCCKDNEYLPKINYSGLRAVAKPLKDYAHSLIAEKKYLKAYDILVAIDKDEAAELYADHYKDFIPGLS